VGGSVPLAAIKAPIGRQAVGQKVENFMALPSKPGLIQLLPC
jgi:hypothetical protein